MHHDDIWPILPWGSCRCLLCFDKAVEREKRHSRAAHSSRIASHSHYWTPCWTLLVPDRILYQNQVGGTKVSVAKAHKITNIRKKYRLPVSTLSIIGQNVYVISSAELMQSLHRHPKEASFWFMEAHFTARLGNMSKPAADALMENLEPGTPDQHGGLVHGLQLLRHALTPQNGLNDLVTGVTAVMNSRLDALHTGPSASPVDLWAWVQHEITVATTEGIYGEDNPYHDRKVENGFWYVHRLCDLKAYGPRAMSSLVSLF